MPENEGERNSTIFILEDDEQSINQIIKNFRFCFRFRPNNFDPKCICLVSIALLGLVVYE